MWSIKKKDTVVVLAGKEKGKKGEVIDVYREKSRVLVSKINFVKRHTKPTQQDPGGIKEKEASLHVSNVMLVCPKCDQPTRPKFEKNGEDKSRVCRKCGEAIL